jgi:hypothetical protein
MEDVLSQAVDLSGKVIVTCSLPMNSGNTGLVIGQTTSGAEELTKMLPKYTFSKYSNVTSHFFDHDGRRYSKPARIGSSLLLRQLDRKRPRRMKCAQAVQSG